MAVVIGFLMGLLLSIPAGPVSLIIVRNSGTINARAGFIALCGLVLAELLYIIFFVTGLYRPLLANQTLFHTLGVVGALFVVLVGIQGLKKVNVTSRETVEVTASATSKKRGYLYETFSITLLNPAIFLFMIWAITTYSSFTKRVPAQGETAILLLAMEIGTITWFLLLIGMTLKAKFRFESFFNNHLQRLSSWLLVAIGLYLLITGSMKLTQFIL